MPRSSTFSLRVSDRRASTRDHELIKRVVGDAGFLLPVSKSLSRVLISANVLRYDIINQLNLGDFQLSQSYLFFYDKLEKANYYLEWVTLRQC
jgi:hypothetical protein